MTNGNHWIYGNPVHDSDGFMVGTVNGLTKREYFAAMAMQGIIANRQFDVLSRKSCMQEAAIYADELIAALNEEAK